MHVYACVRVCVCVCVYVHATAQATRCMYRVQKMDHDYQLQSWDQDWSERVNSSVIMVGG